MPTWTSDQQKVIDTRDNNILVSAAAGSGKTAVLVERIINKIIINTIYEYNLPFNQITCLNENELHMIGLKNYFNSKNCSHC